jgi:hypothetical protein
MGTKTALVYRALLRNPDLGPAGLADHLHLDPVEVGRALEDLRRLGLVGPGPAGVQPSAPATSLASLLHDELKDLEDRRARLDAVRASLSSFAADHKVGQNRGWSSVPCELLSPDEAFVAVEDLQRASSGEVVVSHPVVDIDVDSPTYVELVEDQLRAGRRMRGLYPADVVTDPPRQD